ncbi:predicted kinase related to galactokinase and mevalonate kinase [Longilinea arvoryzae]|uniref:Predicted kinase related to galactokinase and mevalonate kinase n=1 Tax=Longilinea arvoryzae TaxID=360412 RepID=A0A0S7B896_9CHLR|nr:GHMP kinase [Longilinea arvoryzae]GAP13438.1 predicted kinase related to galactokinase and mevalonate kinase [Longilinea arvoryzae]
MIIVQSPLRISLFGGGTDFPDYYLQEGGCVLSTAIDKYVFVVIKQRFDDKLRIGYTSTEMVDSVDEIQHELIRESLRLTGISKGVEITTMGDIPAGSGLGSSSAVTVGALNAMYTFLNENISASRLAREACEIEIDKLKKPIGVQDQYISAFGGLRFIEFQPNGVIQVERVALDGLVKRRLNENLLIFYTGVTRHSDTILAEQQVNIMQRMAVLREMKQMAYTARQQLEAGNVDALGNLLHESWMLKKQLASRISNGFIDEIYQTARSAGALGGKILGAGGGGFLLLYCPYERRESVRAALKNLQELPVQLEPDGSKVIFNYRR